MNWKSLNIPFELIVVALVCIFFFGEFRYKERGFENWTGVFNADVNGYYVYLPALFVHKEMDLSFTESDALKNEYEAYSHYDIYTGNYHPNGKKYTKYYVGTALMQAPFFISALSYTKFTHYLSDGYSMPFQIAMFIAALCYFLAGLYFIKRLLLRLGFNLPTVQITLLAIALGTNAFNYVWFEPGMSHAYVFCCVAGFINVMHSFFQRVNSKDLISAAFFFGLICILRPTSAIIVISLPLLAGNYSRLKDGLTFLVKNVTTVILSMIIIAGFIFIQLLMYKLQVGHWWIWSYGDEGFNFLDPKFFELLIGYRNGLFVYSPLTILFVIGSFLFFRENKLTAITLLVTFVVFNYILSSWWNWWFGGSFGLRAFIDFYPLFSIPLAFSIQFIRRKYYNLILPAVIILGISMNLIQNLQYSRSIIDFDLMTKEKYWQVFLDLHDDLRFVTSDNITYLDKKDYREIARYLCDFEGPVKWPFRSLITPLQFDGVNSEIAHFVRVDQSWPYGATVELSVDSIPFSENLVYKYEADFFIYNKRSNASIVFDLLGNSAFWSNNRIIKEVRSVKKWQHASFEFSPGHSFNKGDTLLFYLNNPMDMPIDIDNVRLSIYALNQE